MHNKSAYSQRISKLKKLGTKCLFCNQDITKEHSEKLIDEQNDALSKIHEALDEIDIHIKDVLNDTGIDSIENPVEELLELKQGLEIYEQSQASLSKLKGEQKEDKGKLVDKNKKKDQIDKQVLKLKNLITELKKEIDAFPDYEKEKKEKNGKMKDIDEELIRITSTLGGIK